MSNCIAANVTAWRCGGILCSVCRQLKPNKGIKFNGFYCCLIYNIKPELPMISELLLIAPTSRRHNAKPFVGCCTGQNRFRPTGKLIEPKSSLHKHSCGCYTSSSPIMNLCLFIVDIKRKIAEIKKGVPAQNEKLSRLEAKKFKVKMKKEKNRRPNPK